MKLFLILITTLLVSCSKNVGIYYKYAYIDSRKSDVVTTHLIESNHLLTSDEINQKLSVYRLNKSVYVLRDTIVSIDTPTNFLK